MSSIVDHSPRIDLDLITTSTSSHTLEINKSILRRFAVDCGRFAVDIPRNYFDWKSTSNSCRLLIKIMGRFDVTSTSIKSRHGLTGGIASVVQRGRIESGLAPFSPRFPRAVQCPSMRPQQGSTLLTEGVLGTRPGIQAVLYHGPKRI